MASGVGLSRDRRIVHVVDMLCLYRHRKKNWVLKKKRGQKTTDRREINFGMCSAVICS